MTPRRTTRPPQPAPLPPQRVYPQTRGEAFCMKLDDGSWLYDEEYFKALERDIAAARERRANE
jgi:hypothetical protein